MKTQSTDVQQTPSLWDEILLLPSKETLIDRFSSSHVSTEAPCMPTCTGVCHSLC